MNFLGTITKLSLQHGFFGDIYLTIFAFIWMFWPVITIYFFELNILLYIPGGLFTLIFMIKG